MIIFLASFIQQMKKIELYETPMITTLTQWNIIKLGVPYDN